VSARRPKGSNALAPQEKGNLSFTVRTRELQHFKTSAKKVEETFLTLGKRGKTLLNVVIKERHLGNEKAWVRL